MKNSKKAWMTWNGKSTGLNIWKIWNESALGTSLRLILRLRLRQHHQSLRYRNLLLGLQILLSSLGLMTPTTGIGLMTPTTGIGIITSTTTSPTTSSTTSPTTSPTVPTAPTMTTSTWTPSSPVSIPWPGMSLSMSANDLNSRRIALFTPAPVQTEVGLPQIVLPILRHLCPGRPPPQCVLTDSKLHITRADFPITKAKESEPSPNLPTGSILLIPQ